MARINSTISIALEDYEELVRAKTILEMILNSPSATSGCVTMLSAEVEICKNILKAKTVAEELWEKEQEEDDLIIDEGDDF